MRPRMRSSRSRRQGLDHASAVREFWSVAFARSGRATGKILVEPDTQGSRLRIYRGRWLVDEPQGTPHSNRGSKKANAWGTAQHQLQKTSRIAVDVSTIVHAYAARLEWLAPLVSEHSKCKHSSSVFRPQTMQLPPAAQF
jgi:hypothetical protein